MSDRKSRFNFFKFNKNKDNFDGSDDSRKGKELGFPIFDSIIPENSPLKKNSNSNSGFFNNDLNSKNSLDDKGLEGVDEKYAKYIFSNDSQNANDFDNEGEYKPYKSSGNFSYSSNPKGADEVNFLGFDEKVLENSDDSNMGNLKYKLLNLRKGLLNKNYHSKTLFGKITFILIFLVLISSIFYFFVYQPFQDELNLEKNSKLNEVNALYRGPLELNDNAYSLKSQIDQAYDIEEIKSIDVLMFATKDWRIYHSSKIVSCKDDFGRVMMSFGEDKNILMSVKDANDFVRDNDAKVLSNVQFEKVNTVIVPISISRLQATAGLISVGSVVDIYSLSDNSTDYYGDAESESIPSNENNPNNSSNNGESNDGEIEDDGLNDGVENEETINNNELESIGDGDSESSDDGPLVSGATVLAILRSKDSGIVDSAISKSNTIIKGNETNPFENTSSYSSDVEEQLKASVLNSRNDNNALDSYLINYGVRLSNFERMSNLGDLDSQYMVLLEVPQGDVNFVINNMDNLILTIPTDFAPNWVVKELNETYYEILNQQQSLDFF